MPTNENSLKTALSGGGGAGNAPVEGGREASVSGPVRKSGQPIVDGEVIQLMCW